MSDSNGLTRDYRTALLRYLPRREEVALAVGYELGRQGVSKGISLLEIVQVHHQILAELLASSPAEEVSDILEAASCFLVESLASYEMTQRGLLATE